MKRLMVILLLLSSAAEAQEEVGTYWLNKTLNKTIVMDGDKAQTIPSSGNGTFYIHSDCRAIRQDTVCKGWERLHQENGNPIPPRCYK